MIDNKPFAMFFNASPRKGWNTHKMLEAAIARPFVGEFWCAACSECLSLIKGM